jgi:HEAT repeat protein
MRHIFWLNCLFVMVLGCGQTQMTDQQVNVEALKKKFVAKETSRENRLELGLALVVLKEGQVFLTEQYGVGQRSLVQAVIDSIHQTQPEAAAQLLARLMAAAGGEAKLHFESQLIKLGDGAVNALVALAESEVDWQTLMRSLDALGKIRAKQGVDVMRAHLSHPNDWVRIAAAHALGDVGGAEVVPALASALEDSSDTVVSAALVGLGKTGDRRAVRACGRKLTHENPRVRAAAVSALGRLGGPDVRGVLEPMLQDADSGVRFKAKQALMNVVEQK